MIPIGSGRRWAGAATAALLVASVLVGGGSATGPSAATGERISLARAAVTPGPDGISLPDEVPPEIGPESGREVAPDAEPGPAARLGLTTGWGPGRADLDRAARIARGLPLSALAGQVIVARWSGTAAPVAMVNDLRLGGVIAFADNITSPEQARRVNRRLQTESHRGWPLFLAVDQEGGIVERVKGSATRFPAFMTAGAGDRTALTRRAAAASAAELRWMGFTVDFAPVADVTQGADPTIGSRSAGGRPHLVARHVVAAVDGFTERGVVTALKHFPGHGSVPADSHTSLPVQRRSRRELARTDLVPFRAAVRAGAPSVMIGHLDVRAVDPGVPASVSRRVVTGLLREQLGFEGLVVTDSLAMAGVARDRTSAQSAVQALRAGADVLLMPPSPVRARDGIVAAVESGRLARRRVEQAAARQIALLLHHRAARGDRPGTGASASAAWSRAAVTSVSGPCRGRLVGRSVRVTGDPGAVALFATAARRAGLGVGRGDHVALLGYADGPATARVVVATDRPAPLARSRARTRLATFGATPGSMRALVDVLVGHRRAPGRLPVRVRGVPRQGC